MENRALSELEIAKQQLALCQQQDRLLEEIEARLHAMKSIAQYAVDHELTEEEKARQNQRIAEHQSVIRVLEKEYVALSE